jgi:hypothetical protein
VWWCTLVIPALRKLRQEKEEFKDSLSTIMSLGYTARPCLKIKYVIASDSFVKTVCLTLYHKHFPIFCIEPYFKV